MLSGLNSQNVDFYDLIAVMADPAKFRERSEELRKLRDDAETKIALAGAATEVMELRAKAKMALEEAQQRIIDANLQADQLRARAKEEATRLLERAKTQVLEMTQAAQRTQEEARTTADQLLNQGKAELKKLQAEVNRSQQDLQVKEGRYNEQITAYTRDLEALASAQARLEKDRGALAMDRQNLQKEMAQHNSRTAQIKTAWEEFIAKAT